MNKIYRAIWNESTRTWVAASELAKSKTKANSVSGQTGASLPSLGKSGMNAFKLGLLVSLVHLSLAIPNAYAAGRTGLTGRIEVGSDTGAGNNNLSNNSVILAGDNGDYCGADHVKSRSTIGNAANALTPLEEYLRFAQNWKFTARNKEFNPYGTTEAAENWVAQVTTGHGGYQNGHTGGVTNLLPRAFGINSFALGCAAYVTGNHGLAFGTNATSTAGGAQAFGIAALAGGRASNAIGISSQATGVSGVALGSVATADGNGSVALGLQAKASANSTVAVGVQSQAGVDSAVAIGNNSKASGKQSISIGSDNDISGEGSIAIGSSATATKFKQEDGTLEIVATGKTRISGNHILSLGNSNTGKTSEDAITASDTAIFGNNNTIAANVGVHIIGNNNKIDIVNSNASATIIGNHASVSAGNGLALGNQTIVSGLYAVAIGNGAQATAEGAVALGAGSVADRAGNTAGYNPDSSVTATDPATNTPVWKSTTGAVAVRNANITRRITDVMAGTQDTDAANFGQLKSLSSSLPVSVDSLSTSISESLPKVDPVISSTTNSISTAIDDFNSEINKFSPDVNKKLSEIDTKITAISASISEGITPLRRDALLYENGVYNAGHKDDQAHKIIHVAADENLSADSTYMVNGGQLYTTNSGITSLSVTAKNQLGSLNDSISSSVSANQNLGQVSADLQANKEKVLALQKDVLQWKDGSYSADHGTGKAQIITNVAAGNITPDSTDAINGSQLDSLSTVTQSGLSTAASGLSSLSVSTATGLNSLSSSINSSLSNANEGVTELKQDALQWNGKEYDAGRNGNIQKITNVAAGTVGENSTDAVNAGQLFKLSNSTSTGLSDLASSLSTIADTHISSLSSGSQSLSTIGDNIVSLSTSFEQTNGRVTALQQNALQWNGQVYDATRDGSTQTLTGITAGRVEADSTDAINGSQLDSLSTVTQSGLSTAASGLSSLSVSTATGLNSLSSSI
ncbi:ESPR-type extended signal peptide-containing protein, partial [Snodgrassella alvi]|uniref:ESPR-type extended signal peptide-containing protein n=2 Tax=Snodgrassella alvi TaxID=1196083 RepID=UPI001C557175